VMLLHEEQNLVSTGIMLLAASLAGSPAQLLPVVLMPRQA
jgi:hypothetical protein